MHDTLQLFAIAKACGWSQIENGNTMAIGGMWRGYPPKGQVIGQKESLPNYLGSLDACREMEDRLLGRRDIPPTEQWNTYWNTLITITYPVIAIAATPRQKCEAFLKAIGKWEE